MDTRCLYLGLVLVILVGCQSYPLGLSKAEWEALPPDQQAEFRRQQSVIDEERRREQAELAARQQAEAAERARREELRLAALYAHARYGDIVTATIEGGLVNFSKHRAYEPVRFEILRGQRKEIEFAQLGSPGTKIFVPVRLSDDGQTFYFDEGARDRIVLINAENAWQAGKRYEGMAIHDTSSRSLASAINIHLQYKNFGHRPQPQPQPTIPPPSQRPVPGKPLPRP